VVVMVEPDGFPRSTLLEDPKTRFFVITSNIGENVVRSVEHNVWATQRKNEPKLSDAYRTSPAVILIFSVNKSGAFQGYARMRSLTGKSTCRTDPFHGFGRLFDVDWLRLHDLEVSEVQHLRNPLDDNRQVAFSRDGQELAHDVGAEVCRLIDIRVHNEDPEGYEPITADRPAAAAVSSLPALGAPTGGAPASSATVAAPPREQPVSGSSSMALVPLAHATAAPMGSPTAPPLGHPPGPYVGMGLPAVQCLPGYGYYPYAHPPPWAVPPMVYAGMHHRYRRHGSRKRRRRRRSSSSSSESTANARRKSKRKKKTDKSGTPDFANISYEEYVAWWRKKHLSGGPPPPLGPPPPGQQPFQQALPPGAQPVAVPQQAASTSLDGTSRGQLRPGELPSATPTAPVVDAPPGVWTTSPSGAGVAEASLGPPAPRVRQPRDVRHHVSSGNMHGDASKSPTATLPGGAAASKRSRTLAAEALSTPCVDLTSPPRSPRNNSLAAPVGTETQPSQDPPPAEVQDTTPGAGPKVQISHGSPAASPGKSPDVSGDRSVDALVGKSQEDAESEAGCSQSESTSAAVSQPGSPGGDLVEMSQHKPQCASEGSSFDSNIPSPPKSEAASLCASQQAVSPNEAQVASPMQSEDNSSPAELGELDSQDAESCDSPGNEVAELLRESHGLQGKPPVASSRELESVHPSLGPSVNDLPTGELEVEVAPKSGGSTASFQSDGDVSSDE